MKKKLSVLASLLPFAIYGVWFGYNRIEVAKLNLPVAPVVAEGAAYSEIGVSRVTLWPHVAHWITVIPRELKYGIFRSGEVTEFVHANVRTTDGQVFTFFIPARKKALDLEVRLSHPANCPWSIQIFSEDDLLIGISASDLKKKGANKSAQTIRAFGPHVSPESFAKSICARST